ncbi:MAG: chromosome segregation protein SMC [Anaerolineales bacterium]|nr:chromosome segregation protein SMC [Anaerolineales bacterium]
MGTESSQAPRLKYLDLQGYKTFASKTHFEFAPAVTSVIGPNGSGKSNIADSIRWVLGEQSFSLLRGKRTEDMIFAGSDSRPRAGMASATITFDNSDGWLPIDFSEVSIGRRAYRDGSNEYWLNGQRVRLRDVMELLSKCGLAQRTYTIIGQGLVDVALSLKADERRGLFEEAAGIGLYRSRREESLRRLDTTRRNLERVQDILAELRPRLRSLERQAKRAQNYEQVQNDLKNVLRIWYGYHWYALQESLATATEKAKSQSIERERLRATQSDAMDRLGEIRNNLGAMRGQLQTWTQQLSALYSEREQHGRQLAVTSERIHWLKDQQESLKTNLAVLQKARDETVQRIKQAEETLQQREQERAEAHTTHEALRSTGALTRSDREALEKQIGTQRESLQRILEERAGWGARLHQLDETIQEQSDTLQRLQRDVSLTQEAAKERETEYKEAAAVSEDLLNQVHTARESVSQAEKTEKDLTHSIRSHEEKGAALRRRVAALETRLEVLKRLPSHEGKLSRTLVDAARQGKLNGFLGLLSESIDVDAGYLAAIAAVLGDFSAALTFEDGGALDRALELVRTGKQSGLAILIPASRSTTGGKIPANLPGSLGLADTFVSTSNESLQPLLHSLLHSIVVVEDQAAARNLLDRLPENSCAVTLRGDLFYPDGTVVLGKGEPAVETQQSIQQLEEELGDLTAQLESSEKQREELARRLEEAGSQQVSSQQKLEEAQEQLQEAKLQVQQQKLLRDAAVRRLTLAEDEFKRLQAKQTAAEKNREEHEPKGPTLEENRLEVEQRIQALEKRVQAGAQAVEMAQAEARLEMIGRDVAQAKTLVSDLQSRLQRTKDEESALLQRLERYRGEIESLQQQKTETEKDEKLFSQRLDGLNQQIHDAEEELRRTEQVRSDLESSENGLRRQLQEVERTYGSAQVDLARRQEEITNLKTRIEDDFGLVSFDPLAGVTSQEPLPLDGLVQRLPRVRQLPEKLEDQVRSLKAQLRRMGAINPEAQQEFGEVRQRIDFMDSQIEDLHEAEQHLLEVIAELDVLMEREFRKTFENVAAAFKEIFTRLFGGGSARLVLTNPDDVNSSGIDIEARLPGRREQGLAMLSGGERSLTACALVFSLLKVSPTPFCVLDEVDAMLDEANVIRFREMLRELSKETQFIVITHNRQTVQVSQIVYGVSMGADSASRMISLKMEDAEMAAGMGLN